MNHFFVPRDSFRPDGVHILGGDLNHMKNVLRLKPGECVSVSDGEEKRLICEIVSYTEGEALLKIVDIEGKSRELPAKILLFQGIPKGEKFDWIIQKSVELGAAEIIPVAMKRCVAKIEAGKEGKKLERLRKIAEAAAKQSGRDLVPEIHGVMGFEEAAEYAASNCSTVIFAYEKADNPEETRRVFEAVSPGETIGVFIGPEGGFDDAEAKMLEESGARTVTLGKRILRTETAPLYLLSVLGFRLEFFEQTS